MPEIVVYSPIEHLVKNGAGGGGDFSFTIKLAETFHKFCQSVNDTSDHVYIVSDYTDKVGNNETIPIISPQQYKQGFKSRKFNPDFLFVAVQIPRFSSLSAVIPFNKTTRIYIMPEYGYGPEDPNSYAKFLAEHDSLHRGGYIVKLFLTGLSQTANGVFISDFCGAMPVLPNNRFQSKRLNQFYFSAEGSDDRDAVDPLQDKGIGFQYYSLSPKMDQLAILCEYWRFLQRTQPTQPLQSVDFFIIGMHGDVGLMLTRFFNRCCFGNKKSIFTNYAIELIKLFSKVQYCDLDHPNSNFTMLSSSDGTAVFRAIVIKKIPHSDFLYLMSRTNLPTIGITGDQSFGEYISLMAQNENMSCVPIYERDLTYKKVFMKQFSRCVEGFLMKFRNSRKCNDMLHTLLDISQGDSPEDIAKVLVESENGLQSALKSACKKIVRERNLQSHLLEELKAHLPERETPTLIIK